MSTGLLGEPVRHARLPAFWLALLAGPMSFGIAGPALILDDAARDLGVPTGSATWVVTAFGWGIAVGTPLMSRLLGHRGTRAALAVCALFLVVGAALVVAVPALPMLVAGSAAQALGAAGMTGTAMNLADSPRRMGLATASLAVVGSVAPLAGSLVADLLSWQVALALPALAVLAVPAVARSAPPRPAEPYPFDAAGAALLTTMVTALVFLPHQPLVAAAGALVAGVPLALWIRARPDGFVPAVLVRTPRFMLSCGLAFALAVGNFALMYALPVRLAPHWTAGQIGMAMVWPLLLGGTLSWFVVAASARVRPGLVIGALAVLGGAAPVAVAIGDWPPVLLVAQAAASIAAASGQGVLAVRATSSVSQAHRPAAIGLFNLAYLLGAAFGPAIVSLLLEV
ncbi:MFS transporter [Nonomuraea sp. NPDC059194]|uniref:MFS transporter n=1 Tax=Nonomuraea sp. NPDC059194 TaxID=3346764 RepID=UPI003690B661